MIIDLDRDFAKRHCKDFRLDDDSPESWRSLCDAEDAAARRTAESGGMPFRVLGYYPEGDDVGGWYRVARPE